VIVPASGQWECKWRPRLRWNWFELWDAHPLAVHLNKCLVSTVGTGYMLSISNSVPSDGVLVYCGLFHHAYTHCLSPTHRPTVLQLAVDQGSWNQTPGRKSCDLAAIHPFDIQLSPLGSSPGVWCESKGPQPGSCGKEVFKKKSTSRSLVRR
jgi:hypothetical protein